jgi:nucleolar protein 15
VDFYSDASASEDGGWDKLHEKNVKGKKGNKKTAAVGKKTPTASTKAKKPELVLESEPEGDEVVAIPLNTEGPNSEPESLDDDQTAALLKGFESSDEEDVEQGEQVDGKQMAEAGIPDEKKVKKKLERLGRREKVRLFSSEVPSGLPLNALFSLRRKSCIHAQ